MNHSEKVLRAAASILLLALGATARADDWPQWRGPRRDGIWRETGVLEKFEGSRLNLLWRAEISSGYSGPTVAGGRVYVMDRVVVGTKQTERVLCFDARSGDELWKHAYDCPYIDVSYPAGPRASVTLNDGRAYSLGTMGNFHCFDAATGNVLWRKDLNTEYKIRMPMWGITCSPLVEDGLVVVQISGSDGADIVAFDKKSGEERWRAPRRPGDIFFPDRHRAERPARSGLLDRRENRRASTEERQASLGVPILAEEMDSLLSVARLG